MSPAPILSQERPSSTWGTCSQGGSGLVSPLWVSLLYLLPNFLAAAAPSNTGAPLLQASFSGPPEAHSTQLPSQVPSLCPTVLLKGVLFIMIQAGSLPGSLGSRGTQTCGCSSQWECHPPPPQSAIPRDLLKPFQRTLEAPLIYPKVRGV